MCITLLMKNKNKNVQKKKQTKINKKIQMMEYIKSAKLCF